MKNSGLFLGLDVGGTKSAAVLIDGSGRALARSRGAAAAIIGNPSPEAIETLKSLAAELFKQAGVSASKITAWGAGMNGIDFADEIPGQRQGLASGLGLSEENLALANDAVAALWAAGPEPSAVLVQHGTGFTAAYRSAWGKEETFDHLDVGRIYDLRFQSLAMARRMLDGRAEASRLCNEILELCGAKGLRDYSDGLFLGRFDAWKKPGLPALVYRLWQEGDKAAAEIVRLACDDYAAAALAMAKRCGATAFYFGGGNFAVGAARAFCRIAKTLAGRCSRRQGQDSPFRPRNRRRADGGFSCETRSLNFLEPNPCLKTSRSASSEPEAPIPRNSSKAWSPNRKSACPL
jgi:N-acetylglucosamine kinase-like BadF-type ATPase